MTIQSGIVERPPKRLSPSTDLILFVRKAFSAAHIASLLTLLLPAFILAACGGGGGGDPAPVRRGAAGRAADLGHAIRGKQAHHPPGRQGRAARQR